MITCRSNKKYEDFVARHRHWRYMRPSAKIVWSEEKKLLWLHLIVAARLLAKLDLPFVPDEAQLEQFETDQA